jgi:hypothetical protein
LALIAAKGEAIALHCRNDFLDYSQRGAAEPITDSRSRASAKDLAGKEKMRIG